MAMQIKLVVVFVSVVLLLNYNLNASQTLQTSQSDEQNYWYTNENFPHVEHNDVTLRMCNS